MTWDKERYKNDPEYREKVLKYHRDLYKNNEVYRQKCINDTVKRRKNNPKYEEYQKKWTAENQDKIKQYRENTKIKLKIEIISHYSHNINACACCGEDMFEFLTIDHINNDGAIHRKNITNNLYTWLRKNNFPEGFQVLCWNCNCGKSINGGICPHNKEIAN